MANRTKEVDQFIKQLKHPLEEEIETVRDIVLNTSEQITEQIKWNAPSFCYNGQDRITFKLHPQNRIQLIFHRGAKVKDSTDFRFEDPTGLLKWLAEDRAMVQLSDMKEVNAKKDLLVKVINQWIERAG